MLAWRRVGAHPLVYDAGRVFARVWEDAEVGVQDGTLHETKRVREGIERVEHGG